MKKYLFMILIFLISTSAQSKNFKKVYFAGGCFWCMEESFDGVEGVLSTVSGYSGGHLKNPTYHDVIYKDTGHVEALEITYDPNKVNYEKLLNIFLRNIDPFASDGQFCDKGSSYLTAVFYQNDEEKLAFEDSKKNLGKSDISNFVTHLKKLDVFYPAEDYHQDYYKNNPIRYKLYKTGCGRVQRLKKIWD